MTPGAADRTDEDTRVRFYVAATVIAALAAAGAVTVAASAAGADVPVDPSVEAAPIEDAPGWCEATIYVRTDRLAQLDDTARLVVEVGDETRHALVWRGGGPGQVTDVDVERGTRLLVYLVDPAQDRATTLRDRFVTETCTVTAGGGRA